MRNNRLAPDAIARCIKARNSKGRVLGRKFAVAGSRVVQFLRIRAAGRGVWMDGFADGLERLDYDRWVPRAGAY